MPPPKYSILSPLPNTTLSDDYIGDDDDDRIDWANPPLFDQTTTSTPHWPALHEAYPNNTITDPSGKVYSKKYTDYLEELLKIEGAQKHQMKRSNSNGFFRNFGIDKAKPLHVSEKDGMVGLEGLCDCWSPVQEEVFQVRQPGYHSLKMEKLERKSPSPTSQSPINNIKDWSRSSAYTPVLAKMISHTGELKCVSHSFLPLRKYLRDNSEREFFVTVRNLPSITKNIHGEKLVFKVIFVFCRVLKPGISPNFDACHAKFFGRPPDREDFIANGPPQTETNIETERYRQERLKYFVHLPLAPYLLKASISALGGYKPCILGNGYLKQEFMRGLNYLEVEIDVTSNKIAKVISSSVLNKAGVVVVDEGFVIESQNEDELSERLLCVNKFLKVNPMRMVGEVRVSKDGGEDGEEIDVSWLE